MQKPTQNKECCKTCYWWGSKTGKHGLPTTYCRLSGKTRFANDGYGCLGWKENISK